MNLDQKSGTCFVISPFGEPFDTYFSHVIKPAVEKCGLLAMRGDSIYRPTTIVDDIWKEIQSSTLLIAELTGRNPNVFYELGMAHAISKPVILISELIDDVPFDLRSIRIILYDKSHPNWGELLKTQLTKSIQDVLESPNSAIPTTFKQAVIANSPEVAETILRIETLENSFQRLSSKLSSMDNPFYDPNDMDEDIELTPSQYSVGQLVFHEKFGKGKVVEILDHGSSERVLVNFEREGGKWLASHFAKLQIIKK